MRYVAENRVDAAALAIKSAFEAEHIDKTLSLKTATALARAALSAADEHAQSHRPTEDGGT